jgi:hypothetical protein
MKPSNIYNKELNKRFVDFKYFSDNINSIVGSMTNYCSKKVNSTVELTSEVTENVNSTLVPIVKNVYESIKSTINQLVTVCKAFLTFVLEKICTLLNLNISLRFVELGVSSGDSQYIKCNFGYYRSKYLRRDYSPDYKGIEFYLSVHTNFSTALEVV